ncbi:hypothetical protein CHS0354_006286 [Potamilus streckersoni]|uniref:Death domain-containing protein n=1 Tax=Potamilus streckersoni TaxID=2493646 RepID=A0AAE0VQG2_9BIVA|nr:hypothetical protein CHS0354_006286 [Potamilus streckersoni]
MENTYTRHESGGDLDEESQSQSDQDSSSEEYNTAPSSPKHISRMPDFHFSSEMDPSELAGHLADKALVSASQYCSKQWQLESQVHTSSGCSLTDPKIVHQPRISTRETCCNFLPGQLGEQARRFLHNIKYAPSFGLELQKEISEAGFVISESKRFISCQYCGFAVISDFFLNTGCNFWAMHYEHCCHLLVYQVDQERQRRSADDQGDIIRATTRFLTEYRSSQSISSMSRGQHSGSFSGRSEGAFSPAPTFHDSETPEMCIPIIQNNTVGGMAGTRLGTNFHNASGRQTAYNMSSRLGPESGEDDSVLSREMQMKYPTDCDLGILSRDIGTDYTQLGLRLGLRYHRIKEIEEENRQVSSRWLAILIEWRDTQRGQATLGNLEKVFQTLKLNTENFHNLR